MTVICTLTNSWIGTLWSLGSKAVRTVVNEVVYATHEPWKTDKRTVRIDRGRIGWRLDAYRSILEASVVHGCSDRTSRRLKTIWASVCSIGWTNVFGSLISHRLAKRRKLIAKILSKALPPISVSIQRNKHGKEIKVKDFDTSNLGRSRPVVSGLESLVRWVVNKNDSDDDSIEIDDGSFSGVRRVHNLERD